MTKKIIYWTSTIFLSLGMLAGGIQQIFQIGEYNEIITKLGYPLFLLSILGSWKILGVIAILIPKKPLLKEWGYAGFFFVMSGATISHIAVGQPITDALPSIILLLIMVTSWYFRPNDRKVIELQKQN